MSFRTKILDIVATELGKKRKYDHYAFQDAEEMIVEAFLLGQKHSPNKDLLNG